MERGREREPVDTYVTQLHGQTVTVKVYPRPAYSPSPLVRPTHARYAVDESAYDRDPNEGKKPRAAS